MIKFKLIKRSLCLLLAMTAAFLTSCSGALNKDDGIKILCTIYPQYDWVKNIVGDVESVTVDLLVENGADVHSYQPSVDDIIRIKQSDAVILVGGESDGWVFEAIAGAQNEAITLLELDGVNLYGLSDEYVASEHEHEHEHEHHHSDVIDEHVWLSVKNAISSCNAICDWLCAADPDNSAVYRANTDKYIRSLEELNEKFEGLDASGSERIIFADRFPFVYLFEDYGVSYLAAFEGCSTDSEADFETVRRLAERLGQTRAEYIAVSESSDKRLASSVMSAAGVECEIVVFDSLQSVTVRQIEGGYSYIGAMESNFEALAKILK